MISLLISRKFFQFLSLSSSDSRSPTALVLKRENQFTFSFLFLRFNCRPLDLWVTVHSSGLIRHCSLGTANYKLTPLIPRAFTSTDLLLKVIYRSSLGWSFRLAKSGKSTLQNLPLSKKEYLAIVLNFIIGCSFRDCVMGWAACCWTAGALSFTTANSSVRTLEGKSSL